MGLTVYSFWGGAIPHWNEIGWPGSFRSTSYKLLVASPLERWKVRDLGRPGNHPGNTQNVGWWLTYPSEK
jgi:hypothetical protein